MYYCSYISILPEIKYLPLNFSDIGQAPKGKFPTIFFTHAKIVMGDGKRRFHPGRSGRQDFRNCFFLSKLLFILSSLNLPFTVSYSFYNIENRSLKAMLLVASI